MVSLGRNMMFNNTLFENDTEKYFLQVAEGRNNIKKLKEMSINVEKKLKRTNHFLTFIDDINILVGYITTKKEYVFLNKFYEKIFDINRDDALGKPIEQIVGEEYLETNGVHEKLDEVIETKKKICFETTFNDKIWCIQYIPNIVNDYVEGILVIAVEKINE